ncbi:hypothetical protein DESA109040_20165 [Deinococcus saxicola]
MLLGATRLTRDRWGLGVSLQALHQQGIEAFVERCFVCFRQRFGLALMVDPLQRDTQFTRPILRVLFLQTTQFTQQMGIAQGMFARELILQGVSGGSVRSGPVFFKSSG